MKSFRRVAGVAGMAVLVMQAWALPMGQAQAAEKLVVGVAIPTATHSFTSGIVWWANQAKAELEKAHPGLKIIVKTAATAPEQANQLQDMLTVNKINTLVIFPIPGRVRRPHRQRPRLHHQHCHPCYPYKAFHAALLQGCGRPLAAHSERRSCFICGLAAGRRRR